MKSPFLSLLIRKNLPTIWNHTYTRSISFTNTLARNKDNRHLNSQKLISKATGRKEDLWQLYNEVVYPPLHEVKNSDAQSGLVANIGFRPGEVTHRREDILYSQKKLWLLGSLIRGRSVDEAFAQLGFRSEKGARVLEQVLEEAIELAVKEHDFEYCTKIWIESVHVSRGRSVPRLYKGLRSQVSLSNFHYTNLYIRLREGDPPKIYHPNQLTDAWTPSPNCPSFGSLSWSSTEELMHRELERLRRRRLKSSL